MSGSAKQRMRYDPEFKLKAVDLAFQTSNMNSARHYSVNEKQVYEWKKAQSVSKEMPKKANVTRKIYQNSQNWKKM